MYQFVQRYGGSKVPYIVVVLEVMSTYLSDLLEVQYLEQETYSLGKVAAIVRQAALFGQF